MHILPGQTAFGGFESGSPVGNIEQEGTVSMMEKEGNVVCDSVSGLPSLVDPVLKALSAIVSRASKVLSQREMTMPSSL